MQSVYCKSHEHVFSRDVENVENVEIVNAVCAMLDSAASSDELWALCEREPHVF